MPITPEAESLFHAGTQTGKALVRVNASWMELFSLYADGGGIASIGFPLPTLFAWVAAFFEFGLILAFLTGAFFVEAAMLAAAYVPFLGFAFYGPSSWPGNPMQMGLFINHLTFVAGLLFAAAHGPGKTLSLGWTILSRSSWTPAARVN